MRHLPYIATAVTLNLPNNRIVTPVNIFQMKFLSRAKPNGPIRKFELEDNPVFQLKNQKSQSEVHHSEPLRPVSVHLDQGYLNSIIIRPDHHYYDTDVQKTQMTNILGPSINILELITLAAIQVLYMEVTGIKSTRNITKADTPRVVLCHRKKV